MNDYDSTICQTIFYERQSDSENEYLSIQTTIDEDESDIANREVVFTPNITIDFSKPELTDCKEFDVIVLAEQTNYGKLSVLSPVYNSRGEYSDDESKSTDGDKPGENQVPDYIIVDDPYGKTYEYSKLLSGNNIWIPFNRCVEGFKNLQNPYFKFAHRFIKPQYLGF